MSTDRQTVSREIESVAAAWVGRRDAGLDWLEEAELELWLKSDPRHQAAFAMHESAWDALAKPARDGRAQVLASELRQLAGRRHRRRRRSAMVFSAAAALALLAVTWSGRRPADPVSAPAPASVVHAPEEIRLPDRSILQLKAGSRYLTEFSETRRRLVLLSGEAHFTVQPDPVRPFVVVAGDMEVRAIGTAFSVQIAPTEISVLVTEGRVALETVAPATAAPSTAASSSTTIPDKPNALAILGQGEGLVVNREADLGSEPRVATISPQELTRRLAWRTPRLEFTRIPLSQAAALFNDHASATSLIVAVSDAETASIPVTGIFRADNVDGFILLLQGGFGVEAERDGRTVHLRRKSP